MIAMTTQNSSSGTSQAADNPLLQPSQNQQVDLGLSEEVKAKLAAWIKSEYAKMKSSRETIQRQWYVNLAMYYGNQYLEVFQRLGLAELGVSKTPNWRSRQKINLIRPMIRAEVARMTSQQPTASVVPATTSDADMFAAQAGEQTWEFLQQRVKFQETMMRNAFWTSITGTGFIKTWWDTDRVDKFILDATSQEPATGNVCIKPSTPFNIFVPDLLEEDIEEEPYVFEAYTKTVPWVQKFWKMTAVPDVVARNEIIEASYFNLPGANLSKPDSVLIIEAWIKPGGCEIFPDGGLFTVINNKIVQSSTFYSHQEYPYAKTVHILTGKFYGDSVLLDINPLQKEYNRTRSQIIESKNRMARPQLLAPVGSIDPKRYTSEPGLIVPYKPALGKPEPLPMQNLPPYVLEEQDRIKADMEDISGQHQVSRGQAPGAGVTAATAISFLQERDDSVMGPTYSSIEWATEKIARQALTLVVDYWDLPRIVEVTGLDQSFDSLELKGSDIAKGKNIRVEGGSALPTSKAARQALLMDMAKMGFISGDQLLDMLDIGGIQKVTERIRIDLRQAQRENLRMRRITMDTFQQFLNNTAMNALQGSIGSTDPNTGLPLMKVPNTDPITGQPVVDPAVYATFPPMVPVNVWDNHAVHISTHNNYRKSQEFETLPDFVKDQFEKHVNAHQQALIGQQMGQQPGQMPGQMDQMPMGGSGQMPGMPPGMPPGMGDGNAAPSPSSMQQQSPTPEGSPQ